MSRIPPLDPDDADDEAVAEFLRTAAEGWYEDTAYFGVIAHRPALLQHLVALFEQFPRSGGIDTALLELMRLKIAQKHGCAYCGTVRTAAVRDEVAAEEQALFAGDLGDEAFTDRERLAVDLADRLSEAPSRSTTRSSRSCVWRSPTTNSLNSCCLPASRSDSTGSVSHSGLTRPKRAGIPPTWSTPGTPNPNTPSESPRPGERSRSSGWGFLLPRRDLQIP